MKKAWNDVKSFVTVTFSLALVVLLFAVLVLKSEEIFNTVFLLFTNLSTAVFTFFFTRKIEDKKEGDNNG